MANFDTNRTTPFDLDGGDATINIASGDTITFSGAISGSTRLLKTGPGTLILSATNDFTGGIQVNDGSLRYQERNNLGTAPTNDVADYVILNGGIFECRSPNQTNVSIPATMGITVNNPSTISNTGASTNTADAGTLFIESIIAGSTHNLTFNGLNTNNNGSTMNVISLGTRTHSGSGTATVGRGLTLSNNGTCSWDFEVNGDLKGTGTFNGDVNFNSTGRANVGRSLGTTMTIEGNLTFDDGSEIWVSYNGNAQGNIDMIRCNGTGTCKVGDSANGVKIYAIPHGYSGNGNIGAATYSLINFAGTGVTVNSDAAANTDVQQYAATQSDASGKTAVNRLTTDGYSITFTSNNLNLVRA